MKDSRLTRTTRFNNFKTPLNSLDNQFNICVENTEIKLLILRSTFLNIRQNISANLVQYFVNAVSTFLNVNVEIIYFKC